MADYSVTCSKLGACADKEQDIIKLIAEYQRAVSDIGYHVRIKGTSEQILRENILAIVDHIEDCKARTTVLSDTLRDIAEYYLNTEKELIATKVSHEDAQDKNTTSAVNEDTNEPESDDLQEAIDFLNNLSMSTSIDGVSIAMNVDLDGDGETGKDWLSDRIDDVLDWFVGDREFVAGVA